MEAADPFLLQRFVTAQEPVFESVLRELRAGRKRSHWMWFVFPQLRGLGRSSTAVFYGITSLDEARAYAAHALLGPRLLLCTNEVAAHGDLSLARIFGSPDDVKFKSCMTLFARAGGDGANVFGRALDVFCAGEADAETLRLLASRA